MQTRKHFITAAASLALIPDKAKRKEQAETLISTFSASNPRFNRARFLSAAGLIPAGK